MGYRYTTMRYWFSDTGRYQMQEATSVKLKLSIVSIVVQQETAKCKAQKYWCNVKGAMHGATVMTRQERCNACCNSYDAQGKDLVHVATVVTDQER
jgi:hypothetical protein